MESEAGEVVRIDGSSLTLASLVRIADGGVQVALSAGAMERMAAACEVVERLAAGDDPVYGVNTGFGHLSTVRVERQRLGELQHNLVRSHCAGVGPLLERRQVRAIMALRANALARGNSGIRPSTVEALLALLNAGIHPCIPSQGSVGASGDLAPLAHMSLPLLGEGFVEHHGRRLPAALVLPEAGLRPLTLQAKEGLSLINGTQVTTAVGALALHEAGRCVRLADVAGAMTLEALKGSILAFDPRVQKIRPHPGQAATADNLVRLTRDSQISESHRDCDRVQDSYALRCMPQVHGAVRDTIDHALRVLEIEMNSSTDNPVVLAETGEMISCGNFHGAPVGYVLDFVAIALADLASISERRTERLVNPDLSGLPAFLSRDPGLHSGFMLVQVTAAALTSENKTLAHPASVDSIPTSAGKEDHVAMSTLAARKATQIATNTRRVLGIEIMAAAQALDFEPLAPGAAVAAVRASVRRHIPALEGDRVMAGDLDRLDELVINGTLLGAAEEVAGKLR